jgi:hypothetical protein
MKPTLFLDIDGVFNCYDFLFANPGCFDKRDKRKALDPAACERLERVLQATGAVIVVSSTWRILKSLEWLNKAFHDRGAPSAKFIDRTPRTKGSQRRHDEIQAYLDEHPEIQTFAILDDESMGHLTHRAVKTTLFHGFLDEHVEPLIRLLNDEFRSM